VIEDSLDGPLDFLSEFLTQALSLSLLVGTRLLQFLAGLCEESGRHVFLRMDRDRMTSSAGTVSLLPCS
jgi:hypothetical protein